MQAGDIKLGSIFSDNHRYEIPMFQRPYVWSEQRNWLPLWQDISDAADGVVADMTSKEWPEEPPTYFLGAIVVKAAPAHPQRLTGSILVDGQQRLTTLQVLLAAARSVAADLGAASAAGRFRNLLENSSDAIHEKWQDDRYKLWPLPQDRVNYLWAVREPGDSQACPDSQHLIAQSRVWFESMVRSWALSGGEAGDRLDALHSALVTRMALVKITLEKTDNAQIIFEALNHRGVELSQSDLIKNLLFRLVEDQGQRHLSEGLLVDHWLPLDGRKWRTETVTGRIRRSLLDQVIAYWLTARCGEVVSVERLYDEFKNWLLAGDYNAGEVIKEIRAAADLYDRLVSSPPDEPTASLVDLLRATKTNTAWPLVLGVWGLPNVTASQRQKLARILLSYLTRRGVCGLTTKDYNHIFVSALKLAVARAEDDGLAAEAVEQYLGRLGGDTRNWPDDGEFSAAIRDSNFYALNRARQRSFFAGLENHLRDSMAEDTVRVRATWSYLNIEHVMPQKWQTYWALAEGADPTAVEQRDHAINLVGNLTLTNGRLNSKMRNAAWLEKKPAVQEKSTFLITTASILSAPHGVDEPDEWSATWDEQRIAGRSSYLTRMALKVWPRPDIAPIEADADGDVDGYEESDELEEDEGDE